MLVVVFLNPFPHTTVLDQLFLYTAMVSVIAMARNKVAGFYYYTPLVYPFVLFCIWAAVSVVFALDKTDSARDLYSHLIRYLIFLLGYHKFVLYEKPFEIACHLYCRLGICFCRWGVDCILRDIRT